MNKMDYKDLKQRIAGKENGKEKILVKYGKKVEANKIVNQLLAVCWGNSSSDSDNFKQGDNVSILEMKDKAIIPDTHFVLMNDTKNDDDNLVTLLGIKKNLKDYSLTKLRSLASVLLDSLVILLRTKKIGGEPQKI